MEKKRVLIVDDAPVTLTQVRRQLEEAGYAVEIATNGLEGMGVVRSRIVDLIITDIVMPVMDGVDFYNELQKDATTARIPVMIITDSVVVQESFKTLGVNEFVAKPIDGRDLLRRVEWLLNLSNHRKKFGKVIVVGNDITTQRQMQLILESSGFTVQRSDTGMESLTMTVKMVPDLFLIDVLLQDMPAKEVIKSLRSFIKLQAMKIIIFTQFDPENISDINLIEQLKESKNACMDVGANKYIGRFSRTTFADSLQEFL